MTDGTNQGPTGSKKAPLNLAELLAQKGMQSKLGVSGSQLTKQALVNKLGPSDMPAQGLVVETPASLEELKANNRKDVIYIVPIEYLDYEDKTFYMRGLEKDVLEEEDTKQLMESLKEIGQRIPIQTQFNDKGRLQIIYGWRRSLSARAAGLATVKAVIEQMDPKMAAVVAAVENFNRKDVGDYQKLIYVKRLCDDFSFPKDDVARLLGYNKRYIYRIMSVYENKILTEALQAGSLSLNTCVKLSEASDKVDPEDFPKLIKRAQNREGNLSDELEKAIVELRESSDSGSKPKVKSKKVLKAFQKGEDGKFSFKSLVNPKKITPADVDALLVEIKKFQEELIRVKKGLPKK